MKPPSSRRAAPGHLALIVEDHPLVAKFYRMALERAGGFHVLVTEDVSEMLAAVEQGRVHVAVVDVSLAGTQWEGLPIDGLKLTRLLKEASTRSARRRLPVLLATAHVLPGDRERLLAASGADDYLEKPVYDAQMLVDKIRKLIDAA